MLTPKQTAALNQIEEGEEYAAYFFKRATGLRWFTPLRERGHFDAARNPAPKETPEKGYFRIPHWPALDYLEHVSRLAAAPENRSVAQAIMEILRSVTKPIHGRPADNYRTWWYFAKVLGHLPTDVITEDDIGLVRIWLDSAFDTSLVGGELGKSVLRRFLNSPDPSDAKKAAAIVDIATELKRRPSTDDDSFQAALPPHWLRALLQPNASDLGHRCGRFVVPVLLSRLHELCDQQDDTYSYVWRPEIEHEAHGGEELRHIFVSAIHQVLISHLDIAPVEDGRTLLHGCLVSNLLLSRRIALSAINTHYARYQDLFWDFISAPVLEESNYHHEVYCLLKDHFSLFTPQQQDRVLVLIERLPSEHPAEDPERFVAAARLPWLHALIGLGHPRAERLYSECLSRVGGVPPERPDLVSYVTVGSYSERTPLSSAEILRFETPTLLGFLGNFRNEPGWNAPSVRGLADALEAAVKQQPERFERDLVQYMGVGVAYKQAIISGFREVWGSRRPLSWRGILEFCLSIASDQSFWETVDVDDTLLAPRREWVTTEISRLLRAGLSDDSWAFEQELLPIARDIIVQLLEHEPATASGEKGDALTEAINTPRGTVLEALFAYTLRRARLADASSGAHASAWNDVRPIFEQELEKCRGANYEFSALAGAYLPNLFYLSPDWVNSKINHIFAREFITNWRCAIEGFAYVTGFYDTLYVLLQRDGHIAAALDHNFKNRRVREKFIQFVTVAYLRGLENLTGDGSFSRLIHRLDQEDVGHLLWFLWTLRDQKLPSQMVDKILDLWRECSAGIRGQESVYGNLLSHLALLISFLTDINEEQKTLLLQAAPYIDETHNSSLLLEEMSRLARVNARAVGEIFQAMLTRTLPTYDAEDIRTILTALYETRNRDLANGIADIYAKAQQYDMVRDLFDRYNSPA